MPHPSTRTRSQLAELPGANDSIAWCHGVLTLWGYPWFFEADGLHAVQEVLTGQLNFACGRSQDLP